MSQEADGRQRILKAVRGALGARGDEPGRHSAVRIRLERNPAGVLPERARTPKDERPDLMAAMLKAQGAEVLLLDRLRDVPQAVAERLNALGIPARLRYGNDAIIQGLAWGSSAVTSDRGAAAPEDRAAISRAVMGAAESGTLILVSGPQNPSTLNFLPEAHFVIVHTRDIVGSYEEAWARLLAEWGEAGMPRTVNYVSAPSATADIEQTLTRGAHGPRHLVVLLIAETQPSETAG